MIYNIYLNIFIRVLILNVYNLIGPIGSGKSEAQKILEGFNHKCFCADSFVRNLYKKERVISDIKKIFPKIIENNKINTHLLRELIFNDISKMKKIERYIQPLVFDEFGKIIEKNKKNEKIFFVIPIIENNKFINMHKTIYINADKIIRKKRLEKRNKYNLKIINRIVEYQSSIDKYKFSSDYYIDNNTTLSNLKKNINEILLSL